MMSSESPSGLPREEEALRYRIAQLHEEIGELSARRAKAEQALAAIGGDLAFPVVEGAQAELGQAGVLFKCLFDQAPVGKCITSLAGKLLRANQAFGSMLGYSADEMRDLSFEVITYADDIAESAENLRALRAGECDTASMETRYIAKGGSLVWAFVITRLQRDAGGQPLFVLTHILDITERKRAEAAAMQLAAIVEGSDDAIMSIGLDGTITSWNDGAKHLFGFSAEEIVGQPVSLLIPEGSADDEREISGRVQSGEHIQRLETTRRRKDGSVIQVSVSISPIREAAGKIVGASKIARDITEQKRSEELLRRAAAYNRSLIEASLDPLVTIGPNGAITDVNQATETVTGCSREELIGRDFSDYFTDPTSARAGYQRVFEQGSVRDYELEVKHRDGRTTPVVYNASVFRGEAGRVVGVFAAARDITDRKRAEDELRKANAELTRSNRELEQFAYVASHDLQEPLRMVSSYTQLLAQRYSDKLDQDATDFIGYAVDGANRMQRLIQDLLTYSRVATRGRPLVPVDVHEALGEAVKNLQVAIEETGALITNAELPVILGDRTQIAQLFQNLVGNGIKFRKASEPPRVHVRASRNRDNPSLWTFEVKDNGIGIDPVYFDRLFVIFQRLHTKQEYPGTGVGLALCKRIVERHDGRIWLESGLGAGTSCFFTLPDSGYEKGRQR